MQHLGLEVGNAEGPAVQQVIGAVGGAEFVALFGDKVGVGGHKADIGKHRKEVGGGRLKGVDQGVVVYRLNPQLLKVGDLLGVELVGVGDDAANHVGGLGLVLGVYHPAQAGDKVVGGDGAVLGAVALYPLGVVAEVEGPGKAVLRGLPAGGQGGLHHAVLVILHQGVDDIGGGLKLQGGAGVQVVEGSYLRGVELAVDAGAGRGGRGAAAVTGGGAAAGRGAAAAVVSAAASHAQQYGAAEQQGKNALHVTFLLQFISSLIGYPKAKPGAWQKGRCTGAPPSSGCFYVNSAGTLAMPMPGSSFIRTVGPS